MASRQRRAHRQHVAAKNKSVSRMTRSICCIATRTVIYSIASVAKSGRMAAAACGRSMKYDIVASEKIIRKAEIARAYAHSSSMQR